MNKEFELYYSNLWGSRWPGLRQALMADKVYNAIYPYCDVLNESDPYYMDVASVKVAQYLAVKPGEKVLDMCAAPGGKAMILLNQLQGKGVYWANDKERYDRLVRVIQPLYPAGSFKLTSFDGRSMGLRTHEKFDAILLDAPCSSESHWMKKESLLSHWRITRPKRLAIDQYALLASALMMLPVGGRVLYATCAINPYENQGVIQKAQKRWGDKIKVDVNRPDESEDAGVGFYFLPDRGYGGPLYACQLWRVGDEHASLGKMYHHNKI